MANPGMQRRQIEDSLVALARKVDTQGTRWLDGEAFSQFVSGWQNLALYYQWTPDTTLDANVLKLYMRFAVLLRRIIEDKRVTQGRRQQAKTALRDLNGHLDNVFRQIERSGGARAAV